LTENKKYDTIHTTKGKTHNRKELKMRTLNYELMNGNTVVKTTTNYTEVVEWDKNERYWHRTILKEVPPTLTKKQEKERAARLKKVDEVAAARRREALAQI